MPDAHNFQAKPRRSALTWPAESSLLGKVSSPKRSTPKLPPTKRRSLQFPVTSHYAGAKTVAVGDGSRAIFHGRRPTGETIKLAHAINQRASSLQRERRDATTCHVASSPKVKRRSRGSKKTTHVPASPEDGRGSRKVWLIEVFLKFDSKE